MPHSFPWYVPYFSPTSPISPSELARRLGVNEKEARRLLDPRHGSKAAALERALAAVGWRLTVEVQAAT